MKEFPRKFLSLRDKDGIHRRSPSVPPGHRDKPRPSSAEVLRAIFKKDGSKNTIKSDHEQCEPDQAKIDEVQRLLQINGITDVATDYVKNVMMTNITDGDPTKAADFIQIEEKASSGHIEPYNPNVRILGAENRGNVTCYLDALLFAMFVKLDAFECMLKTEFPVDDARMKLVTLLRIWVNLLRSGRLIRTDLTKLMQETLSDCGWPDARRLEQQDTSEAFAFLTEKLQLPLLSLQVDLFHHGQKDKDDHKVVYERLLNLAVPPDDGKGVKLEDCLEEYFNARVNVKRVHEESRTGTHDEKFQSEGSPLRLQGLVRLTRPEDDANSNTPPSSSDAAPSQHSHDLVKNPSHASGSQNLERGGSPVTIMSERKPGEEDGPSQRPSVRARSTSVIQRVVVDERGRPTGTEEGTVPKQAQRKGSTIVKAVTIPAWQFFRLIPWHALTPNEPRTDSEVALNFDQKPVVGICLKRYAMTESGQPQRRNTFIDIPDSLRLPHFMLAEGPDVSESFNGLSTEYKLVLQSVVCHRGDSLQSGHYISFARVAPKLLTDNRRHKIDPPPDYEEAQWVMFDDANTDNRVVYVDDIKKALSDEMPYLLFYQIVPMVDLFKASLDGAEAEPPSYDESRNSFEMSNSDLTSSAYGALGGAHGGEPTRLRSKPPSIRLSAEMDRSARSSLWTTSHSGSTPMGSRRQSIANTESSAAATPCGSSPVLTPVDESTTSRLSRAASRFTLGRQSRPPSQSSEGRISFSMARLGGLMKSSRDPLADSNGSAPVSVSTTNWPVSEASTPNVPESPVYTTPQSKEKHKHRSSKTKLDQQGDQPERECAIM